LGDLFSEQNTESTEKTFFEKSKQRKTFFTAENAESAEYSTALSTAKVENKRAGAHYVPLQYHVFRVPKIFFAPLRFWVVVFAAGPWS
jgi:hypothetical protein